ncbi:GntR family transcriptional regulator [Murinocardiopsis flavida]|uniref:GntR family transcriptional regulator n=1 Tax=Murinocardiopsis flavida TaxID=645275 RepID=UPI001B806748|nr:GntR family transcriptional regulator [Murinocardiopsis flavida]
MTIPLHQRLSDELRARVASGRWQRGFRLPSEAELCAEFGTSRGPVRQALAALRSEGLITGGRGRPPEVSGAVPAQSFSTFMSFSEWAAGSGFTPGQHTYELARRPACAEVAAMLDVPADTPAVDLLRLRLLDGVPAMIERTSFPADVGRLLFDFDTDSGSVFAYLRDQGVPLARGHHVVDAVAADPFDSDALQVPEAAPLLRERRRSMAADGRVLEASDDRYRPDLVTFSIENSLEARAPLTRVHSTNDATEAT